MDRRSNHKPIDFYHSAKWLKLRQSVLAAAGYKDQLEERAGRTIPADTVHHIFPREKYPQYELKRWNLIAISNDTHELLHNRATGALSPLGWGLLEETAEKYGVPISRLTLVIGMPGSGKTTFVKRVMGNALVYDLDYIAGAFRLKQAHEERNEAARKMANSMVHAFAVNAHKYAGIVYIIRTAPTMEEFFDIRPDSVVICNRSYSIIGRKDYRKISQATETDYKERIEEIRDYCRENDVELIEV